MTDMTPALSSTTFGHRSIASTVRYTALAPDAGRTKTPVQLFHLVITDCPPAFILVSISACDHPVRRARFFSLVEGFRPFDGSHKACFPTGLFVGCARPANSEEPTLIGKCCATFEPVMVRRIKLARAQAATIFPNRRSNSDAAGGHGVRLRERGHNYGSGACCRFDNCRRKYHRLPRALTDAQVGGC
jgi:hypothetical protein